MWPDVVVLDIVMPIESGLKVLEYMHGNPKLAGLPVAVLTGSLSPTLRGEAVRLGAALVLEKVAGVEGMVRIVREIFTRYFRAG